MLLVRLTLLVSSRRFAICQISDQTCAQALTSAQLQLMAYTHCRMCMKYTLLAQSAVHVHALLAACGLLQLSSRLVGDLASLSARGRLETR